MRAMENQAQSIQASTSVSARAIFPIMEGRAHPAQKLGRLAKWHGVALLLLVMPRSTVRSRHRSTAFLFAGGHPPTFRYCCIHAHPRCRPCSTAAWFGVSTDDSPSSPTPNSCAMGRQIGCMPGRRMREAAGRALPPTPISSRDARCVVRRAKLPAKYSSSLGQ